MSYIRINKIKDLACKAEIFLEEDSNKIKYLIASQIDKAREIELVINRIDFGYHKNFIIFGLRNLALINEIYKRKTPFSTITIIEITEDDTQSIDVEGEESQIVFLSDPMVSLIIGCEDTIGRQFDKAYGNILKTYNLRNLEIISMPYIKSMYPKEFNDTLDMIFQKLYTSISSYGNDVEDILIGMDNYINNWSHIFRGLDCKSFNQAYKGKPAIIVGAGPSLDKNVELLKNAKGKALIFSVDGALNTLRDKDIIPDVISSIERIQLTTNFYKNTEIPEDTIYVGPNVILGSVLNKFNKIIFTGRKGDGLFCKFNESIGFTNLDVGINVAHVLLSFARYLGCYPIVFMGLDLAYTNGVTHTKKFSEYFDKEIMDNYKKDTVYVKGLNGEALETSENFMNTKVWIESFISSDSEGLYINATEGGAKIIGALNLKLSEVISTYCTGDDLTKLSSIYDNVKKDEVYNEEFLTEKALNFFNELSNYFEEIIKTSQVFYDKLYGSKKMGRVDLMENQRMKMDNILDQNKAGRFILQSITISYNRDIHSYPMRLEKEDEKKMFERSLGYYKTVKNVSEKVIESIDIYKIVLQTHLERIKSEG